MNVEGTTADRFWAKVDKSGDCWVWTAARNTSGYGHLWVPGEFSVIAAHRVSYELFVGPIPEGLQIDHLCRNRLCVNPAHLEAVTQRENVLRGISLSAMNARKERCKRDHEPNWRVRPNGNRECRDCDNEKHRRRYHQKRAVQSDLC